MTIFETADDSRLVDDPEFRDLVTAVARQVGLLPEWIEKDYWVVRVLEALTSWPALKGRFVFKGGTSLSKAWKIIDRFSEDVDLLLTGADLGPMPASRAERAQVFREVRKAIEAVTPLRLPLEGMPEADKVHYYLRADTHGRLRYPLRGGALAGDATSQEWILVEAGFRGGANPWEIVQVQSYLGEYLVANDGLRSMTERYSRDVELTSVPVLSADRTFVEKLLAIHTAAIKDLANLQGRHYYDLAQLFRKHPGVQGCLEDPLRLRGLVAEAVEVSNAHWGADLDMTTLDLARSPALNPTPAILEVLDRRWRAEQTMYPRGQPQLEAVLDDTDQIRQKLRRLQD